MSIKTQVTRGLKWQAINIVGRQLLSLAVFSTLARLLEPSAFGLVGLVGVYLAFVGIFTDQGISTALVQRENLESEHLDAAFWFNLGSAGVVCLATILLAGPVAVLLGEPRIVPLLRWSSLSLVISAASAVHATLFLRNMDFRSPTIRTLLANLAGGGVGVGMAMGGYGVWALVGQQLVAAFAGSVFIWIISSYRPSLRFSIRHLRELFHVGISVFGTSILWFLSCRLDQIVIGRFAGVPDLGLYVVAGKVPDMAKMITHQPVASVSLPALSRLQNDYHEMRRVIYRGMELNAMISFAVFVGIAAVASDLVPVFFGEQWLAAAAPCSLLAIYALVNVLQVFFHPALLASGGAGRYVLLNVWHAIGVLVASVAGIHFGVNWLVLGLIANGLIVAVPALLFLRARIGLSPAAYCQPCLAPALASLFMFGLIEVIAAVLPSDIAPALRLACKVVAGAVGYVGFLFLFNRKALSRLTDTVGNAFRRPSAMPASPPVG